MLKALRLNYQKFLFFISFCFLIFACQAPNASSDRAALQAEATQQILALHELQRTYHFDKMSKELVAQLSNDHISVNRGNISSPSKAQMEERFTNYFKAVDFEKWDDLQEPVIRFSDDISMAYVIVDKEVIVKYPDEAGDLQRERTKFSWVAIYRKHGAEWQMDCMASTNQPSEKL